MFVDADGAHPVEPGGVREEGPLTFGQDRVVGGVPRHRQPLGDPRDRQMLKHQRLQRPPDRRPGELRLRLGRRAGVLPPHPPAAAAPVPAHGHRQRRRTPPERLVCQLPNDGVPRHPFATAAAAPPVTRVGIDHPARQDRPVRLETLPGHLQAQPVQAAEGRHIGAREGSVEHVGVFLDGSVRTSILRRPRPSPRQRRALHPRPPGNAAYTPDWDEPLNRSAIARMRRAACRTDV